MSHNFAVTTVFVFSQNSLWACGEIHPWYDRGILRGILGERGIVSDCYGVYTAWQIPLRIVRHAHLCCGSGVIIVSMINEM